MAMDNQWAGQNSVRKPRSSAETLQGKASMKVTKCALRVGWLVCWFIGWLVGWSGGWLVGWLVAGLRGCWVACLLEGLH